MRRPPPRKTTVGHDAVGLNAMQSFPSAGVTNFAKQSQFFRKLKKQTHIL